MQRRWRELGWVLVGVALLGAGRSQAGRTAVEGAWSAFHGSAARTGVAAAGLAKGRWRVAWTYQPPPKGNGFLDWGPVVWQNTVYTPDGLNHIVALDAASGAVRWTQQLVSNTFTVSCAESAGLLLATTAITTRPTPTLFALDPATGATRWDNTVNGQPAVGGIEGVPAIVGDRVFINYLQYEGSGGVAAYEVATGKLLWRHTLPKHSSYSPVTADAARVYVGTELGQVLAFDAGTGAPLWSYQSPHKPQLAGAVVEGDRLFVASGDTMAALRTTTGDVLWRAPIGGTISASSPAYYDGRLYVGTQEGKLVALNAQDGASVWATDLGVGALDSAPAIDSVSGLLVTGSAQNVVVLVDAKRGRVVSRVTLSKEQRGTWKNAPAIVGGRIYIGSLDKTFYALTTE